MNWIEVFVETSIEGLEIVSGLLYGSGITRAGAGQNVAHHLFRLAEYVGVDALQNVALAAFAGKGVGLVDVTGSMADII